MKKKREALIEWLKEKIERYCNEEKCIELSPYSYDDYIHEETVLKYFNDYTENKLGYETFSAYVNEMLNESLSDEIADEEQSLLDEIKEDAESEGYSEALEEYIEEFTSTWEILESAGYNGASYDLTDYLRHDYRLNLLLGTASERNFDMGAITGIFEASNYEDFKKQSDNALSYLIHQQGYTLEEVIMNCNETKESSSDFVKSVSRELAENTYSCLSLTCLVQSGGNDLLEILNTIAHEEGYIKANKDCNLGLFDEFNGAGCYFCIEAEKPFVFPASMVRKVQIEGGTENRMYNWTVGNVGNFNRKAWSAEAVVTEEQPELIKETEGTLRSAYSAKEMLHVVNDERFGMSLSSYYDSDGKYIVSNRIKIADNIREAIVNDLKQDSYLSENYELDKANFIFCAEGYSKRFYDLRMNGFTEPKIEVTAPAKSDGNFVYIQDAMKLSHALCSCVDKAAEAVKSEYGQDKIVEMFSLESQIRAVTDLAKYVLDHDANVDCLISNFGGDLLQGGCIDKFACDIVISLDDELDDVYNLKLSKANNGSNESCHILEIDGIDELEKCLRKISEGTAKAVSYSKCDTGTTIECSEIDTFEYEESRE